MAMLESPFRSSFPWLFLVGLLFACSDQAGQSSTAESGAQNPDNSTPVVTDAAPEDHSEGAVLYRTNCALCHGEKGDGQGIVPLDRPARSFLEGAFSFGNTPKAVTRTITNGIGGTQMPGFSAQLSAEEIQVLAAYVIALGPEQDIPLESATVLHVGERPQVARGGLPPIQEGLAVVPRGLLLGGTDGLTFQYDAETVRLLGVRQGDFVKRKDWENRGGDLLEPLGKLIHVVDSGDPKSMWLLGSLLGGTMDVNLKLRATEVSDGQAWIEYSILDGNSKEYMSIRETGSALSLGGWSGYRRVFKSNNRPPGLQLTLREPELNSRIVELGESGRSATVYNQKDGTAFIIMSTTDIVADGEANMTQTVDFLFGRADTPENLAELAEAVQ
jgi:mono/diheme cytochrome c family protein